MRNRLNIICCFLIGVTGLDSRLDPKYYPYNENFQTEKMQLMWSHNDTHVDFYIRSTHDGYISLGINNKHGMSGAEIIVYQEGKDLRQYHGKSGFNQKPDSMAEKYWELIIAEKETIEATGKVKTHMILRRPLTVTECGNCWAITESPLFLQWAVGESYDGADSIMYHGQTGKGHSDSKVRIFRSEEETTTTTQDPSHDHDHDHDHGHTNTSDKPNDSKLDSNEVKGNEPHENNTGDIESHESACSLSFITLSLLILLCI